MLNAEIHIKQAPPLSYTNSAQPKGIFKIPRMRRDMTGSGCGRGIDLMQRVRSSTQRRLFSKIRRFAR